jgi:CHAT domain-containing protein
LVSLTRGFMYAGAPRVDRESVGVSDWGTTELMVRFYQGILKDGMRPAAALRAAQVSLMNDQRWASPYYWAPFTCRASGDRDDHITYDSDLFHRFRRGLYR